MQIVSAGPGLLCSDVLNPGTFTNTAGSGAIIDVNSTAGTELTFNWFDPSDDLIATTMGEVLSPDFVRGSLDASFFTSVGLYEVHIVNNSTCCAECTFATLEVGNLGNAAFAEFEDMNNALLGCGNEAVNITGGPVDGSIPAVEQWQIEDTNGDRIELGCLLYTSPSPRDRTRSRMPSSA